MTSTLDTLIRARAEVVKDWGQGPLDLRWGFEGPVCVSLACGRVVGYVDARGAMPAWTAALAALEAQCEGSVVDFNDDPSTTKADVLAMFDRAINAEAAKVGVDPAHDYAVCA